MLQGLLLFFVLTISDIDFVLRALAMDLLSALLSLECTHGLCAG